MKNKSEKFWKEKLSSKQYEILREKATEAPFTSDLLDNKDDGTYKCVACGNELFSSDTKFESGSGWPSFTEPANLENIELEEDYSHGMYRTEVKCKNCGGHLGHLFSDGPKDKGGKRYCINGECLLFEKNE